MVQILITMEVEDEFSDENDDTGLTDRGYEMLADYLLKFGSVVDVEKV